MKRRRILIVAWTVVVAGCLAGLDRPLFDSEPSTEAGNDAPAEDGSMIDVMDVLTPDTFAPTGSPGSLDTSFINGPIAPLLQVDGGVGSRFALTVDRQSRVYIGGFAPCGTGGTARTRNDVAIVRLRANGTVDTEYGNQGRACIALHAPDGAATKDETTALAFDGDNLIAAVLFDDCQPGETFCLEKAAFIRLLPSGLLDTSFGQGGIAYPSPSQPKEFAISHELAAASNRIYTAIAGYGFLTTPDAGYVVGFDKAGKLDSFGVRMTTRARGLSSLALIDGGVVAVGPTVPDNAGLSNISVQTYTTSGADAGVLELGLRAGKDVAGRVVSSPQGLIVGASTKDYDGGTFGSVAVARVVGGAVDPSFGDGGTTLPPLSTFIVTSPRVLVQADGKIVVGGLSAPPSVTKGRAGVVRLDAQGLLESAYGTGGIAFNAAAGSEVFVDLALDPLSGKTVVLAWAEGFENLRVYRFNP